MTRLNLILFFALMFSALGIVNSQHKARNLYIALEQSNQMAKQIEQEYGQLQLEQSTWAMHSRIEQIAAQQMQMQVPDAKRIQVVSPNKINVSAESKQKVLSQDVQPQNEVVR